MLNFYFEIFNCKREGSNRLYIYRSLNSWGLCDPMSSVVFTIIIIMILMIIIMMIISIICSLSRYIRLQYQLLSGESMRKGASALPGLEVFSGPLMIWAMFVFNHVRWHDLQFIVSYLKLLHSSKISSINLCRESTLLFNKFDFILCFMGMIFTHNL